MSTSAVPEQKSPSAVASGAGFGAPQAEFAALVGGCGLFELADRARIMLAGKDRVRWLNGMISNKIRDLAAGQGVYAFVLNPQGHVLGDLYAYNRGESLLVETGQAQLEKLLAIFKRYIIMDDVRLENLEGQMTAVGIAGPKSGAVLQSAGFQLPELGPLHFLELPWGDGKVVVVRSDNPGVESFEFWLPPPQLPAVRDALVSAGATQVGSHARELLRIASGIPRYGQDIQERDLPQETEQQRALNFNKGCYIGQEIVERIRSRGAVHRKFSGFLVEGPLPAAGVKIQADGKDVGEITSSAFLPLAGGEGPVALGYLRREAAEKTLNAAGARLSLSSLPFPRVFEH